MNTFSTRFKEGLRLFFQACLLAAISLQAQPEWQLPDDSASLGLFKYDFTTTVFEGGSLRHYPSCSAVDSSGIPWVFSQQQPMDFGWDLWTHACTGDSLFYGTIVWSGSGAISVPRTFMAPDSFLISELPPGNPASFTSSDLSVLEPAFPDIYQQADSIWNDLADRTVMDAFADLPYHVYRYLYSPAVGLLNAEFSKWIFFVYGDPLEGSAIEVPPWSRPVDHTLVTGAYPNPFNGQTAIRYTLSGAGETVLQVYDLRGRLLTVWEPGIQEIGEHQHIFEPGDQDSGLLFYRLQINGETRAVGKLSLIK